MQKIYKLLYKTVYATTCMQQLSSTVLKSHTVGFSITSPNLLCLNAPMDPLNKKKKNMLYNVLVDCIVIYGHRLKAIVGENNSSAVN